MKKVWTYSLHPQTANPDCIVRACSERFWRANPHIAGVRRGGFAMLFFRVIRVGDESFFQPLQWEELQEILDVLRSGGSGVRADTIVRADTSVYSDINTSGTTYVNIAEADEAKLISLQEQFLEATLLTTMQKMPPRLFAVKSDGLTDLRSRRLDREGIIFPERGQIPYRLLSNRKIPIWQQGLRLTTSYYHYGATAIFYPGLADYLSDYLSDDYYLTFRNEHELFLLPAHLMDEAAYRDFTDNYVWQKSSEGGILRTIDSNTLTTSWIYRSDLRELVEITAP